MKPHDEWLMNKGGVSKADKADDLSEQVKFLAEEVLDSCSRCKDAAKMTGDDVLRILTSQKLLEILGKAYKSIRKLEDRLPVELNGGAHAKR